MIKKICSVWWVLGLTLCPVLGYANNALEHGDPIAPVLIAVTALFFCALLGRYVAQKINQPGVLGELLMGILIGNLCYWYGAHWVIVIREGSVIFDITREMLQGLSLSDSVHSLIPNAVYAEQLIKTLSSPNGIDYFKIAYVVDIFSRYGLIFLLFLVGLESSVEDLKKTGKESVFVALLGIVGPMLLGFAVSYILMPTASLHTDLFVAATLCATSVGITARVLGQMNKLHTREARTIMGAAMLDDILGLILLALVSSIVINNSMDGSTVVRILICTVLFFGGALYLVPVILRKSILFVRFLDPWEGKLVIVFLIMMGLAWLASEVQLAAIIGAFTAGVIIHDNYFKKGKKGKEDVTIHRLISPLESILAPLFFIVIGIQVKVETFNNSNVLLLASGLIVAAIIGKLISGLGAHRNDDRLLIGIGMLPRGEVGLVFASIGRTLGVVSDDLFSAIVCMVVITTVIAPPLLKMRFVRQENISAGR